MSKKSVETQEIEVLKAQNEHLQTLNRQLEKRIVNLNEITMEQEEEIENLKESLEKLKEKAKIALKNMAIFLEK